MTEEQKDTVENGADEATEATEAKAEEKPKASRSRKKPAPKAKAETAAAPAEEKPKRTRRKKEEVAAEAEVEAAEEEAETEEAAEAEVPSEEEPEEKPKRTTRRRAAETSAPQRKRAPRRAGDGAVIVRAQARYVRTAPRKARLVIDHIRGKSVDEARAILTHTPRAAARDVAKLLDSAIANAENNHELVADDLVIHQAYVDEGPTLKRYRPRALGRATRIRKRTSHLTITLSPKE
jgi:ribosomal protein L22